jgi:hypothetical protein
LRVTRKKGERELFGIVVQPRLIKPEPPELYAAVLALRRQGLTVFRAGRDRHTIREKVTGRAKRVTTPQLLLMARP